MKNYKTPEIEMMRIAEIGDVITFSEQTLLKSIGAQEEDERTWGDAN